MSTATRSATEAVDRLGRSDSTLKLIGLNGKCSNAELAELVDCLLARPNVVKRVYLSNNQLTDETAVKLGEYLAASSTVQTLTLSQNQLGSATYLALAAALRINSSLRYLDLFGNQAVDRALTEAAFVEALRLNPDRPAWSGWYLYSDSDDFPRLKEAAEQLGHPSLQLLLALLC